MHSQNRKSASLGKGKVKVSVLEFPNHTNQYNLDLYRVRVGGFDFFVKESVERFSPKEAIM
jgi:hypothetical protein